MVKKTLFLLAGLALLAFTTNAQQSYKVETDNAGNKELVGKLDMQMLVNDSAYTWFYSGVNKYQPDSEWVHYIKYYRDSFRVVVFGSTWDQNSRELLPSFYRTMISAGYPLNKITLYGVDHDKHTLNGEATEYNINKLPTIIVLHKDKELGRIEEVPVQSIEANLVAILQTRFAPEKSGDSDSEVGVY